MATTAFWNTDLSTPLMGLRPKLWIAVGRDYSREDVKQWILESHTAGGLSHFGVLSLPQLAAQILGVPREQIATRSMRQEALRLLMRPKAVHHRLPELKRLKRQRTFFRKLDRAIQNGRSAFAHADEAQVFSERLREKLGPSALRSELEFLGDLFQTWLEAAGLWDDPRLLEEARKKIQESGWPEGQPQPEKMLWISQHRPDARSESFLGACAQVFTIERPQLLTTQKPVTTWQRWHTVDDAAEALAERFASYKNQADTDLVDDVVLIPEDPEVKRALQRALALRGVPILDPRDPLGPRKEEALKHALLPLQLAASRFERESVVSFVRGRAGDPKLPQDYVREIYARGIHEGLASYAGGKLTALHEELTRIAAAFKPRQRLDQIAEAHLKILKDQKVSPRVLRFFEKFWNDWWQEWKILGESHRRAPFVYWWERLRDRWDGTTGWIEPLRPTFGARIYRSTQSPPPQSTPIRRLWVLGLPADTLDEPVGDYWFTNRDREILSGEFQVLSRFELRQERLNILKAWVHSSENVCFLDNHWTTDGKESDSLMPLLKEIDIEQEWVREDRGSHPRWLASLTRLPPVQPQKIDLSQNFTQGADIRLKAGALDDLSRCGFLALGRHRWKCRNLEEPDIELPPHIKGILLHQAVEELVRHRDGHGLFSITSEEALDRAWKKRAPQGLLQGLRLQGYVKKNLIEVLDSFSEDEAKYIERAQTRVLSLENDLKLTMKFPEGSVSGRPDRIDLHPQGVFVIDYKTSSDVPTGKRMLQDAYRLQMPFYALAAQQHFKKAALGLQFICLTRKSSRSRGVFFKDLNGKQPGSLTQLMARNASLLDLPREEVWSTFETQIRELLAKYAQGQFTTDPKDPRSECRSCSLRDSCGRNRLTAEAEDTVS